MAETLLFAFHDETLYAFQRAERYSASVFGGPWRAKVTGQAFGPQPLHHIGRLAASHIPALGAHHLFDLPLIYGMHYDECRMRYRVVYGHEIELLDILPAASSDGRPYPGYPALLPYVPLRLQGQPRRARYDQFAELFPNMPDRQPADLVVAVPPPAGIGMSLWGDYGDGDGVTIVFACDLSSRTVHASNVTS